MQARTGQRPAPSAPQDAAVFDLEFERKKRLPSAQTVDRAAAALADFRAGRASFQAVLAAIVAPFADADGGET